MQKKNKYYAKLGNGGTLHITHPEKQNHKHKTSGTALTFMFCFPVVHCLTSLRYLFFSHFQSYYYVSFSSSVLFRFHLSFSLVPFPWSVCLLLLSWLLFYFLFRASRWFVCPHLVGFLFDTRNKFETT